MTMAPPALNPPSSVKTEPVTEGPGGNPKKRGRDEVNGTGAPPLQRPWVKTPMFLTKTFEMINDCDPNVATWTENGDMFVVKDQALLESSYIPRYFGHANFSSFTRQLNFYGFRKVFPESVLRKATGKDTNTMDASDKYVSFFHEKFKKGRQDLLHQIRRSSTKKPKPPAASATENELEELRKKVTTLENRISVLTSEMNSKIAKLTGDFDTKIAGVKKMVTTPEAGDSEGDEDDEDDDDANPPSLPPVIKLPVRKEGPASAPNPSEVGPPPPALRKPSFSFLRGSSDAKDDNTSSSPGKRAGGSNPLVSFSGLDRSQLSPTVDSVMDSLSANPPRPAPKIGRLTTEEFFNGIFEENGGGPGDTSDAGGSSSHDISSTLLMLANQNKMPSRMKRYGSRPV